MYICDHVLKTFLKEELLCQHVWKADPGSEEIIAFV